MTLICCKVSNQTVLFMVCSQVLYTRKNFVVCAPTGSGKTVLLELAIIRLLMEMPEPWTDVKAVYSEHALCLARDIKYLASPLHKRITFNHSFCWKTETNVNVMQHMTLLSVTSSKNTFRLHSVQRRLITRLRIRLFTLHIMWLITERESLWQWLGDLCGL